MRSPIMVVMLCALAGAAESSNDDRLVILRGDAFARGRTFASKRGVAIRKLFQLKSDSYAKTSRSALQEWKALARNATEFIQRYAPVTWAELQGAASAAVDGVGRDVLEMLAVEYDFYVNKQDQDPTRKPANAFQNHDKCSGLGTPGLSGQNNDEIPELYLGAEEDIVLSVEPGKPEVTTLGVTDHLRGSPAPSEDLAALIYTHPGWPAYMGINCNGLSVLWQYIDNGERNPRGVPTNVLIREMLAQPTLQQALDLLERAPKMVPNNFILTDSVRVVNVEVSPSHFTVLSLTSPQSYVVHTNHVLFDMGMQDGDIGIHLSKTTVQRYKAMREMAKEQFSSPKHGIDPESLGQMLHTRPVFRDGKNGTDNHTLASMTFDSRTKKMRILFKGDETFRSYTVADRLPADDGNYFLQ